MIFTYPSPTECYCLPCVFIAKRKKKISKNHFHFHTSNLYLSEKPKKKKTRTDLQFNSRFLNVYDENGSCHHPHSIPNASDFSTVMFVFVL